MPRKLKLLAYEVCRVQYEEGANPLEEAGDGTGSGEEDPGLQDSAQYSCQGCRSKQRG